MGKLGWKGRSCQPVWAPARREYAPHELPVDEHGLTAFQRQELERMTRELERDRARADRLRAGGDSHA
ncbi:hypothetical protein GCM10028777_02890 [Angustibacter speluncae]